MVFAEMELVRAKSSLWHDSKVCSGKAGGQPEMIGLYPCNAPPRWRGIVQTIPSSSKNTPQGCLQGFSSARRKLLPMPLPKIYRTSAVKYSSSATFCTISFTLVYSNTWDEHKPGRCCFPLLMRHPLILPPYSHVNLARPKAESEQDSEGTSEGTRAPCCHSCHCLLFRLFGIIS